METPQTPQKIRPSELARHWDVSPAYVSRLTKLKGMPEFYDFGVADSWRAMNAPAKAARKAQHDASGRDASIDQDGAAEKIAEKSAPQQRPQTHAPDRFDVIDIAGCVNRAADFDEVMIGQAVEVPQIAFHLYKLACKRGSAAEIANATKNWNDAAKAAGSVREKFLETQEKTRALIPLDMVMDIVGTELQAVRTAFLKLGDLIASKANPTDPVIAKAAIDAGVDMVLERINQAFERSGTQLATG